MLRNPDPGDWLMIRRNYQAWSYSPLNQITANNVKGLQLAVGLGHERRLRSEPTPIVHNGIMFLANTGNTVQALDAKTGDLIWENRVGSGLLTGTATRSLGLYDDKVFLATTDAHIVALDARTGKLVWDTMIADHKKGYQQHERPDGDQRQGASRAWAAATSTKKTAVSSAPTMRKPASSSGSSTPCARDGEPGGDTWGKLPNLLRAGGDTWITGSYDPDSTDLLGRGAGQAVDARQPRRNRER